MRHLKSFIPIFVYLLFFLSIFISFSSCTKKVEQQSSEFGFSGTIKVSGAWALYPMMVKWGEEFQKIHPNVRVDISAGGAGKGVSDALAGLVDLGMVSREIKQEEIDRGGCFVPVVKDAVFPVINAANPALSYGLAQKGMTRQQFIDLWITGKTLSWGEIVGTELPEKVAVYTRSDACGAAETWAKYLGKMQENLQGIGVYGDPGLAEAVKQDKLGIGFNNLNYAYDMKTGLPVAGLQVISIDVNENGVIDPEEDLSTKSKAIEAIMTGHYPSPPARDLYLLTKNSFQGLTRSFILWILSEGQNFVEEVGYIKLAPTQIERAMQELQ
ncbi:MAG: substrate-binding domain-containing protein [candidate division KSB1 bacterium]|nr:substrate-binding domain-containing protein [candidate division KSB1 bacterium]MDZ7336213.1 substrate-binding domain-containing protein [candidate division KSB1 bacterium]MDZ7358954.1 substrate-binding domain-containing protein [candidate division KSB1 bacterium]MDZ7402347.1 substrate-binding domain-containing protein [candidate division KSB1 bacterium]